MRCCLYLLAAPFYTCWSLSNLVLFGFPHHWEQFSPVTRDLHVAKFKGYVLVFFELKLSEALYATASPSYVNYSLPVAFMTHSPSFLLHLFPFLFSLPWRFILYYLIRKYWCSQVYISSLEPSSQLQAYVFSNLFQISS